MNYNLNKASKNLKHKQSVFNSLKKLFGIISDEKRILYIALIAIFLNAILSLIGPYMVGYSIDNFVTLKDYHGLLLFSGILLLLYILAFIVNYSQMRLMGEIGQRMLYNLRNSVFNKLQELPLDFFNQNKAGDLISRINNDTQNVNQFFSQSFMRFIGSLITMTGAAVILLVLNFWLGLAALSPAVFILIFTRVISPWIRRKNEASLKSLGYLSAEVQEDLSNFKVVVAYNRRDYFRKNFKAANEENYKKSVLAGIANTMLTPIYTFASNIGSLVVLVFGIWLIIKGHFTVGLLISFIAYIRNFYNPLRQLAALWASFQRALAAWDRISLLLSFKSNLQIVENTQEKASSSYILFKDVSFSYPNGTKVLHKVNFDLQRGKTYAFVGPTGGGKTTTASLIARLYDRTEGSILLEGKDIRTFSACERAKKIGFILQEPFLFSGTVRENILYGNPQCSGLSDDKLEDYLSESKLLSLINRFDNGLDTVINNNSDGFSIGQKQIIAFMRAIIRKPELLILDEATANVDTVTEQLLENILNELPDSTTKVIIAHRLNTIENADEIFFVNSGEIVSADSFPEVINLFKNGKQNS